MRARLTSLDEVSAALNVDLLSLLGDVHFDALTDSLFVSGSIVDGFGNLGSDVDLYIIEPSCKFQSSTNFWSRGRRWVDEVRLTYDQVDDLIARLAAADCISAEWWANPSISRRDLDVLHRLSIAIQGATPVETECAARIPIIERDRLRRVIAAQHVMAGRSLWLDSTGAYLSGDLNQASYAASLCLLTSIDAWLALLDETNVAEKWRWLGARRADLTKRDPVCVIRLASATQPCAGPTEAHLLMRRAAAMLFACECFLSTGQPPSVLPTPDRPDARFEMGPTGVVLIQADGTQKQIPKHILDQRGERDALDPFLHRYVI